MSVTRTDLRFSSWLPALAVVALLAGACGGDDDDAADEAASEVASADASDASASDGEADGTEPDDTESDDGATDAGAGEVDETTTTVPVADDDDDAEAGAEGEVDAGGDDPADVPDETTTTVAPTTTQPSGPTTTLPADTGLPPEDERGENEAGVRIDLDETATLVCANAEFARDSLRSDDLDGALQFTAAAADRAEPSAVTELADLVPQMRAAQTASEIEAVIDETLVICVDRGHQI